jgi:thymidylate synthase (FAD)
MTIETKSRTDVELVQSVGDDDGIVHAARISLAHDRSVVEAKERKGLINYLMAHKHGTPFEHNSITFRVHAPLFEFREWMRHRVQSYNEQSGRYSKFEPVFYLPGSDRPLVNVGTSAKPVLAPAQRTVIKASQARMVESFHESWAAYEELLALGVAKEVARNVLPVAVYSTMYATTNLRGWLHFLGLRTSEENATFQGHPQWEIEQAALDIERELAKLFPDTLEAFNANGRVAP